MQHFILKKAATGLMYGVCKEKLPQLLDSYLEPDPTIVIYNASVVNFYNAAGSLARFKNKNILFYYVKRSSLLQRWRCSCK
jgi:hypothetical protein